MALHIILLGLVLLMSLGFFVFGWITEHKIFFVAAFIVLMLSGIFIQAEQGIILEDRVSQINRDSSLTYESVEYSTSEPSVNLFAWLLVLVGGCLTAYSGFVFVFSGPENNSFHY
jgi:formate-dependent nitrite reductase membrane component NrfD